MSSPILPMSFISTKNTIERPKEPVFPARNTCFFNGGCVLNIAPLRDHRTYKCRSCGASEWDETGRCTYCGQ